MVACDDKGSLESFEFLRASGLLAQYDLVDTLVRYHQMSGSPVFHLSPSHILELHRRAYFGLTSKPGTYRSVAVVVGGHSPPPASEIEEAIQTLCDQVNAQLSAETALRVAAYVLWRLNWIHPFVDGNGTTARAVTYLVLSMGLGLNLPGTPTIPEQIRSNRERYYSALAHADATCEEGEIDLTPLEQMLGDMLYVQLSGITAVSHFEQEKLDRILELRVRRSPIDVRTALFGAAEVTMRLWTDTDYIIVQIGPESDIASAQERQNELGDAFPRLISSVESVPQITVDTPTSVILKDETFDATRSPVLKLGRNAAVVLAQPAVSWQDEGGGSWCVAGSLYILRLGHEVSTDRLSDALEPLLVRHITEALRNAA